MWYFLCLNQSKFWRSGGTYTEVNLSGRAHSVLCVMSLFITTFFLVVPHMFDPVHYWDPYLGLQGPPAAGGSRQTSISDYGRLHNQYMFLYSNVGILFV